MENIITTTGICNNRLSRIFLELSAGISIPDPEKSSN
jgi:hypothetical protein